MSFALYDLEDDVRQLLNTENFLNGLPPHDFVEDLSKDHIFKGAEVNKLEYLDPKPYIRTFESTLRHLKQLAEDAQAQTDAAARQVDDYELSHSRRVLQLSQDVQSVVSKFDDLDGNISAIASKIDPVNHALNSITTSRDRSTETIFLIRSYHGFYTREKYEPLEKLRTARDPQSRMKCARTTNNLLALAQKINALTGGLPKTAKCVTAIEKYGETMEQVLVDRFETASEDNDFKEMGQIARILQEFNGGSSAVSAFMNKSDLFFADPDSEADAGTFSLVDSDEVWTKLADPAHHVSDLFEGEVTEHLLNRLRIAVKGQARIVQQVFEHPASVLKIMVQRVYAQMIQNKVSTLLSFSQQHGSLAHMRILHALYVLVGDFTKHMKEFFDTNDLDDGGEIAGILDQCYYDIFIGYLTDNAYFHIEKETLETVIFGIAHEYTAQNDRALAKRELEQRLQENDERSVLNMAAVGAPHKAERNTLLFVDKRRVNKFKDFVKGRLSEISLRDPNRNSLGDAFRDPNRNSLDNGDTRLSETSLIQLSKVQVVLKLAIEAVARVLELTPARSAEHSLEILEILVLDFGGLYIGAGLEVAFDRARHELSSATAPQDPQFDQLRVFGSTSEILFLVSSCVKRVLLPCTVNNPPVRARMISLTNNFVERCETALNLLLETTVESVTSRLSFLLQKQKKKDFLCDTIDTSMDYTEVCESISDFLIHLHGLFRKYLSDENLANVLIKVGMIALNLLLEHFKNFSVNSTGGIVLTQDVIRYQSVVDGWGIAELSERFQILREISNLFTVQPNLINSLISEGHLASLKVFTVKQYIAKRTDFSPTYMERFFGRK